MKDILGNQVIIEQSEMFAKFFLDGCNIPPKYYCVAYGELIENFIKEVTLLQEKAGNAYSESVNETFDRPYKG
jgi:hypothetical protein